MSTIKDVARLAGVSASTVSRVVNGNSSAAASAETRERIWDAVRKTNYSLNLSASALRKPVNDKQPKQSIDCIFARGIDYFIDPFFVELIHVMESVLFRRDYRIRCEYGVSELDRHMDCSGKKRSAAIILGRVDSDSLEKLKKIYRQMVYVSLQDRDLGIDSIICSGRESAKMAVNYLISFGHRKICYLGETRNEQRYDGYIDAMRENGLEKAVLDVRFTPRDSYEALNKALDEGMDCTAILCANDVSTVGVYRAVHEHRLSVPQDISVIGINDIETVRYLEPMLTTIHIPINELGTLAANLLIDRIEGRHTLPVRSYLPCQLVERASCKKLRKL